MFLNYYGKFPELFPREFPGNLGTKKIGIFFPRSVGGATPEASTVWLGFEFFAKVPAAPVGWNSLFVRAPVAPVTDPVLLLYQKVVLPQYRLVTLVSDRRWIPVRYMHVYV